ncbi:MAG: lysoplasmalogenase [Actinomycetia bacterium]|nr:lysoplasmalogenase [Actinomycetes bacterium]
MIWIAIIIALAVAAALVDEGHTGAARSFKMAASTGVVLMFWSGNPAPSPYGWAILAALIASWIGDLALSFPGRGAFIAGLLSFAGAHVLYSVAFVVRSPVVVVLVPALVVVGFMGWRTCEWLVPHAPGELKVPLVGYVAIISIMVVLAFATQGTMLDARIPFGAVVFAGSDVFVARQRFVSPGHLNRVIGLPMYFTAQPLFVASV